MKRLALAAIVIIGLSAVDGGEKKEKDLGPDGAWRVVGMEQDGRRISPKIVENLNLTLTIKGDAYTVTMGDKIADKGTIKIDAKKMPNTVDVKPDEGKNKIILAIREIEGDSMKVCYDMQGKGRPTEFSTKAGSGHVLLIYKRASKKQDE